ncbi:MAG: hypothetical protein K9J06_12555 [Flavobacteriales bacterium]|nr:hypothetical protein [Flavobacteriales bacterium]
MKCNASILLYTMLSMSVAMAQSLPDVTTGFDSIAETTRNTGQQLRRNWPLDERTLLKDLQYVSLHAQKDSMAAHLARRHGSLSTVGSLRNRFDYLVGIYETDGKGDLRHGAFKQYYSPETGGRVRYGGQEYTVDQLNHINFGIALRAMGITLGRCQCFAACYGYLAETILSSAAHDRKDEFLGAVGQMVATGRMRGVCLPDNMQDSTMVAKGYHWFDR